MFHHSLPPPRRNQRLPSYIGTIRPLRILCRTASSPSRFIITGNNRVLPLHKQGRRTHACRGPSEISRPGSSDSGSWSWAEGFGPGPQCPLRSAKAYLPGESTTVAVCQASRPTSFRWTARGRFSFFFLFCTFVRCRALHGRWLYRNRHGFYITFNPKVSMFFICPNKLLQYCSCSVFFSLPRAYALPQWGTEFSASTVSFLGDVRVKRNQRTHAATCWRCRASGTHGRSEWCRSRAQLARLKGPGKLARGDDACPVRFGNIHSAGSVPLTWSASLHQNRIDR